MPYTDPEKYKEYQREYRARHRASARAYNMTYRALNAENVRESDRLRHQRRVAADSTAVRQGTRRQHLRREYGISQEQFEELRAVQGSRCAICRRRRHDLHVDHNHRSGEIRGLLCGSCNRAIGLLRDDPDLAHRASVYLTKGLLVFVE